MFGKTPGYKSKEHSFKDHHSDCIRDKNYHNTIKKIPLTEKSLEWKEKSGDITKWKLTNGEQSIDGL